MRHFPLPLVAVLVIAGCTSSGKITSATQNIQTHTDVILAEVKELSNHAKPDDKGRLETVRLETLAIREESNHIISEIPNIEDKVGWFGRNLKLTALIVVPTVILIGLWYTGVLGFVRGFLRLVTPRIQSQAKLTAERVEAGDVLESEKPLIAISRTDPVFNGAYIRTRNALRKEKEEAAASSST